MITPPSLVTGDKIGIVAPARKISEKEINPALSIIKNNGLEPVLGENLFSSYNQFAGTDTERAKDFQKMLDNPEIKAIICVRGGYGSVRIIDKIDFSNFLKRPKWLAGYSDFTVFLNHVSNNFKIETLHSTMPINFTENSSESLDGMFEIFHGKRPEYIIEQKGVKKYGKAKGKLIGGNLSVLYSILGSNSFPKTDGNILFIEDLDEYLYHIDRMMLGLKRAGIFNKLSGLVIGAMTKMNDNTIPFGKTAEEIIYETVSEFDFPLISEFPAGHIKNNLPLLIGANCTIEVNSNAAILKFKK